jgi:hypothetical protein
MIHCLVLGHAASAGNLVLLSAAARVVLAVLLPLATRRCIHL